MECPQSLVLIDQTNYYCRNRIIVELAPFAIFKWVGCFAMLMKTDAEVLDAPKLGSDVLFHANTPTDRKSADEAAKRVTLLGALANLILTIAKAVVGMVANSAALIADAVHSAADLISDFVVWVAIIFGSREADENHPYGHRRFETMATLLVSILIIASAIVILRESILRLDAQQMTSPTALALVVATASILVKEILYRITIKVGRKHHLPLVNANAHHHRSDALSSVAAFIGIAGSLQGITMLDLLAAIVVGLMLFRVGFKLGWDAILEISDIGVDNETLEVIQELIVNESDVVALHLLKTRHVGGEVLCEVHIQVPPRITVTAGHQIAERVRLAIIQGVPRVSEVTVHVDPEDDEDGTVILARRQELLEELGSIVAMFPEVEQIGEPLLHMLFAGCEVVMAPIIAGDMDAVTSTAERLTTAIMASDSFIKATIHLRLSDSHPATSA